MMGIRTVCFVAAMLMFVNHLGWLTAIPAVGALVIPYFAVVLANGGREPTANRTFRQYEPELPGDLPAADATGRTAGPAPRVAARTVAATFAYQASSARPDFSPDQSVKCHTYMPTNGWTSRSGWRD